MNCSVLIDYEYVFFFQNLNRRQSLRHGNRHYYTPPSVFVLINEPPRGKRRSIAPRFIIKNFGRSSSYTSPEISIRFLTLTLCRFLSHQCQYFFSSMLWILVRDSLIKGLLQIVNQVVRIFHPNGKADGFRPKACGTLFFQCQLLMRCGGRVDHQRLGIGHIGKL